MACANPGRSSAGPEAAAAVAEHFGGDVALYDAFAASCARQFSIDMASGREACAAGDLHALGTLAHNLKSALLLLGHAELSDLAARVDRLAAAGDIASACARWRELEAGLVCRQTSP